MITDLFGIYIQIIIHIIGRILKFMAVLLTYSA